MTNEQQVSDALKELAAAQKQLTIALGLDHEELLQEVALQRMLGAVAGLGSKASRQVQQNAWLQRLKLITPELASRVETLYPCARDEDDNDSWPCSLCVLTCHYWYSEEEFQQAEAKCKAIAEKLAELLAAVPGPIERVDVVPGCHDSNLAEVAVRRNGEQGEAGQ